MRISTRARRASLRIEPATGHVVLIHPAQRQRRAPCWRSTAEKREWIATHLGMPCPRGSHLRRWCPRFHCAAFPTWCALCLNSVAACGARRGRSSSPAARSTHRGVSRIGSRLTPRPSSDRRRGSWPSRSSIDVAGVSVRDTTSRWGSCTQGGRLSFSWRLILAPDHVLTYVIAHEVAHLKHMNHGPAFWRTVDELLDGKAGEAASARHWLRKHGAALHRYG